MKVVKKEFGFSVVGENGIQTLFDEKGNFISHGEPDWMRFFSHMDDQKISRAQEWAYSLRPKGERQEIFRNIVVTEDVKSCRISCIEASYERGKLYFREHDDNLAYSCSLTDCDAFAPEWKSGMASLGELFTWYAHRGAQGLWSLEYICDDSSEGTNNSIRPERSAFRKIGGFYDGIGNTRKVVTYNSGIVTCGASFLDSGYEKPVASFEPVDGNLGGLYAVPVIALRGDPFK